MKLLIINQPLRNRGDESAHRALMNALVARYPDASFNVLFFNEPPADVAPVVVQHPHIAYETTGPQRAPLRLARFTLSYPILRPLVFLLPPFRQMRRNIRRADLVISAPGGICMGLFRNWLHVLWLDEAHRMKKPVAYYARSFGPFPTDTSEATRFKRLSLRLLHSFRFLSIRDQRTMQLAEQLGLRFVPTIDTAFLNRPESPVPTERNGLLPDKPYVVFVPNQLTWHPAFAAGSQEAIDTFYLRVINTVQAAFPDHAIAMLPQLYGEQVWSDAHYFKTLQTRAERPEHLYALSDTISSDQQQRIIAGARLVIGARYHSIVFAINNETPFLSLSYEHKMVGLLALLGLDDRQVDISALGSATCDHEDLFKRFQTLLTAETTAQAPSRAQAQAIAQACFDALCETFIEPARRTTDRRP